MENPSPRPLLKVALEALQSRPLETIVLIVACGLMWLLWWVLDSLVRTGRVGS
jgi:hypothetical protein